MLCVALDQAFGIAGQLIGLKVDAISHNAMAERRDAPGVRNDRQGEPSAVGGAAGHRETDPINGDAGLVADVATETGVVPAQFQLP